MNIIFQFYFKNENLLLNIIRNKLKKKYVYKGKAIMS